MRTLDLRMRKCTTDSGYWGLSLEDMLAVASDEVERRGGGEPSHPRGRDQALPREEGGHHGRRGSSSGEDLKRKFEHFVSRALCCNSAMSSKRQAKTVYLNKKIILEKFTFTYL